MIKTLSRQLLSTALSLLLVSGATVHVGAQQSAQQGATGYSGQGAPLSAEDLQQLLAPVALYPDSLVAQILGAATHSQPPRDTARSRTRTRLFMGTTSIC